MLCLEEGGTLGVYCGPLRCGGVEVLLCLKEGVGPLGGVLRPAEVGWGGRRCCVEGRGGTLRWAGGAVVEGKGRSEVLQLMVT